MKILFTAIKGGVGKSTIISNMASTLAGMGKDVLVMDADRQGTSYLYHQYRLEHPDKPQYQCSRYTDDIRAAIKDADNRYDIVLIDTAGSDSTEARTAMAVVDVIVTPLSASQPDLDTIFKLLKIVNDSRIINPGVKFCGVLNMLSTHARIDEEAESRDALADLDLPLLKSVMYFRRSYRTVMSEGLSVTETKDHKAALEMHNLVMEILSYEG